MDALREPPTYMPGRRAVPAAERPAIAKEAYSVAEGGASMRPHMAVVGNCG